MKLLLEEIASPALHVYDSDNFVLGMYCKPFFDVGVNNGNFIYYN